jgi:hypothetical protein
MGVRFLSGAPRRFTMKQATLVTIGDLLFFARSIGFDWNRTHDQICRTDRILDGYQTQDVYLEYIDDENWSDRTKEVIKGFMEDAGITEMTLIME